MQNRIYIKFEVEHQIDGSTSLHKRGIDCCRSVNSTVVQVSNQRLYKHQINSWTSVDWRLHKHQFDSYTSIESTFVQALNQQLHKRRFDGFTSLDLTIAQALIRWVQLSDWRSYWSLKKSSKIFRCPFNFTVVDI